MPVAEGPPVGLQLARAAREVRPGAAVAFNERLPAGLDGEELAEFAWTPDRLRGNASGELARP